MFQSPHSSRRDYGNPYPGGHGLQQLQVIAHLGAVPVHAGQQDLAGPQGFRLLGPVQGIQAGGRAAAMDINVPGGIAAGSGPLGIDGNHHALAAEFLGSRPDQSGILDGCRVQGHLVGAGPQNFLNVAGVANPSPDRKGDEYGLGNPLNHLHHGVAVIGRGRNIQKDQFIGALPVVPLPALDRVACIHQVHEMDPFDHAPPVHVQAGNNALRQHNSFRSVESTAAGNPCGCP